MKKERLLTSFREFRKQGSSGEFGLLSWTAFMKCARIMRGFRFQASLGFELESSNNDRYEGVCSFARRSLLSALSSGDSSYFSPYWRQGLEAMLSSKNLSLSTRNEGSQRTLERLFDIELEFTFSTSEQVWAAFLVLALDIQDFKFF